MSGETIFVVEDDPDVRAYMATVLSTLGYSVVEAEDGPSAVAMLDGAPKIDLLLTDMMLPGGMNGIDVAQVVRDRIPDIRVIYTSGYTDSEQVTQKLSGAGVEFLPKPYTIDRLTSTVRKLLDAADTVDGNGE